MIKSILLGLSCLAMSAVQPYEALSYSPNEQASPTKSVKRAMENNTYTSEYDYYFDFSAGLAPASGSPWEGRLMPDEIPYSNKVTAKLSLFTTIKYYTLERVGNMVYKLNTRDILNGLGYTNSSTILYNIFFGATAQDEPTVADYPALWATNNAVKFLPHNNNAGSDTILRILNYGVMNYSSYTVNPIYANYEAKTMTIEANYYPNKVVSGTTYNSGIILTSFESDGFGINLTETNIVFGNFKADKITFSFAQLYGSQVRDGTGTRVLSADIYKRAYYCTLIQAKSPQNEYMTIASPNYIIDGDGNVTLILGSLSFTNDAYKQISVHTTGRGSVTTNGNDSYINPALTGANGEVERALLAFTGNTYGNGQTFEANEANATMFGLFSNIFTSLGGVFNISILPNVTIGALVFLPLVVIVILAIIKLLGK